MGYFLVWTALLDITGFIRNDSHIMNYVIERVC